MGEATFSTVWDGDYSFSKEGGFELDVDLEADIPIELPVDAGIGTEWERARKKAGKGRLTVTFKVEVKTRGGERL